ncbi:MAG: class I SAM-dependent methyltransferase [Candidatus Doudnabacteria bacterium]
MISKLKKDWTEYFENTKEYPPSKLLIEALCYVNNKHKAIDIGGGALKDTRYLLSQGFDTTVIDKEDQMATFARKLKSDRLHYFITTFANFDFPENEYDIASAIYSLPFNLPEDFDYVLMKVKNSLVKGGIFCGQFFGERDDWHINPTMTFHSGEKVKTLLADMNILLFEEKEFKGKTANNSPKYWHVFNVIARKK